MIQARKEKEAWQGKQFEFRYIISFGAKGSYCRIEWKGLGRSRAEGEQL